MSHGGPLAIINLLARARIDAIVIGGHAVIYHGYLRTTEDIDLIFRRTPESEPLLYEVLSSINAYWISEDINPQTGLERTYPISLPYIRQHSMLLLGSDIGYIDLFDFIPGIPGATFDDIWRDAVVHDGCAYASLTWLKQMKRSANRLQDELDLENLP
jgi:hypothetical protein